MLFWLGHPFREMQIAFVSLPRQIYCSQNNLECGLLRAFRAMLPKTNQAVAVFGSRTTVQSTAAPIKSSSAIVTNTGE